MSDLAPEGDDATVGGAGGGRRKRSHVVLWSMAAVAVVLSVLIAVLASSSTVSQGSTSSPLVGKKAPPVSGPYIGAPGRADLAEYLGRWVLVNFAASWCIPCRQETPEMLAFAKEHEGQVAILAVAFDPADESSLASFLKASKVTWHAISDAQAAATYGVGLIPESYLVDPAGRVVAKYFGGVTTKELDSFISRAQAA